MVSPGFARLTAAWMLSPDLTSITAASANDAKMMTATASTVEGGEGTVVGCALGKLLAVGFDIHGGSNSVRICGNGHRLIRSHGASSPTIIN